METASNLCYDISVRNAPVFHSSLWNLLSDGGKNYDLSQLSQAIAGWL